MSGDMCATTEKKVLDHLVGKTTYTFAADACYVGLCTNATPGDPTMATPGTWTELTIGSNGYTRQQITGANWVAATQSGTGPATSASGTGVTFTNTTSDWGAVYGWGLFTAASAGTQLFWGTLSSSVTMHVGDSLQITTGNLTVTLQ